LDRIGDAEEVVGPLFGAPLLIRGRQRPADPPPQVAADLAQVPGLRREARSRPCGLVCGGEVRTPVAQAEKTGRVALPSRTS
jgi:hypothetical protein